MLPLSIGENLLYTTVKITSMQNGRESGTGTGFIFTTKDGNSEIPTIVTNKHVIKSCDTAVVIFHTEQHSNEDRPYLRFHIEISEWTVAYHPNPSIDLCAIFIGDVLNQLRKAGNTAFYRSLDRSLIPTTEEWQNFDAIETVTMIGCPNGISDEVNHFPIARQGITATHMARNYNGKREFVIDMACFPGSSGSPVLIYNRDGYFDKKSSSFLMGRSRLKLVGVLYEGPLISSTGTITLSTQVQFHINNMMHLGHVIKADELIELEAEILRVAQRIDDRRASTHS